MRRVLLALAGAAVSGLALPDLAAAHTFVGTYEFPIPRWLWFTTSCAVVALTFVLAFARGIHLPGASELGAPHGRHATRPSVARRIGVGLLELVSVALMALAIVSLLAGSDDPNRSFGVIYFWVVWWVAVGTVAALFGDLYARFSPWAIIVWRVLAPIAGDRQALGVVRYPSRLGRWPAVLLLVVVAWLELVWTPAREPRTLGLLLVAFSAIALTVPLLVGIDAFTRLVDPFGALSALLGRAAPLGVVAEPDTPCEACVITDAPRPATTRVDCATCFLRAERARREIVPRFPGSAVEAGPRLGPSGAALVAVALGSVIYDGLSQTYFWRDRLLEIDDAVGLDPNGRASQTAAMLAVMAFLAVVLFLVGRPLPGGASGFAVALIPIAAAYFVAHYFAYVAILGQLAIPLVSDPLDRGWNLFGTAGYNASDFLTPASVWYLQVGIIVLGHVAAVIAGRRIVEAQGAGSVWRELPAAILTVAYTFAGLWVLAEQIRPE